MYTYYIGMSRMTNDITQELHIYVSTYGTAQRQRRERRVPLEAFSSRFTSLQY